MEQCSYINEEARCYGVTLLQNVPSPAVNCLLNVVGFGGSSANLMAVSAVLMTGPYPNEPLESGG